MNHIQKLNEAKEAISKFSYIRFTFFDMNGIPRGMLLPTRAALKFLQEGIGVVSLAQAIGPNSEIIHAPAFIEAHYGNVKLIPDLDTLHPVTWLQNQKHPTGQLICGTYWNNLEPQEGCSRNILSNVQTKLDNMDIELYSGMEVEFTLLNKLTKEPVCPEQAFLSTLVHTEFHEFLKDIEQNASRAGILIDAMHTETGAGQFEFITVPAYGIKGIDACVILKQSIKEWALQNGQIANFMAKPFQKASGNAMHLNFSLWKMEQNMFWDNTNDDNLSDCAKFWIAGMLHHASALTAICCPTTNCYLRLHKPFAPHFANWGIEDRQAMLRVKNEGPNGTYIENRLPSGLCNPYLVMAATIAAGIDGVMKRLSCPQMHNTDTATILPSSLEEALDCLQKDDVMVETLGKTFVEWFVMNKTSELKDFEGITDEAELLNLQRKKYLKFM